MKVVMTIAGSDSSGGAGVQADLKTFEAFGVFGTSVLTVLTAQNTTGVTDIFEVSPSFVKAQIDAVLKDFDVAAIKIGMLYSKEIIIAVREAISELSIPIVIDPVFISKVGSPLLQSDAVQEMKTLFQYAKVITPNTYEAKELFAYDAEESKAKESMIELGVPILVKHHVAKNNGEKMSVDKLYMSTDVAEFAAPYLNSTSLHGTGCSYSSAIAANLALGESLEDAIAVSKSFISLGIENAPSIGNGAGPINHKYAGELVGK